MPTVRLALMLALSATAAATGAQETMENALGMRFVQVPAGSFQMGTPDLTEAAMTLPDGDEAAIRDETPAHRVQLSRPFWLGETEVTQAQWLQVMENRPGPAENWQRADWRDLPAVGISWHMAQRFATELSTLDPVRDYRLPTEAEWEYAARAGSDGLFPWPEEQLEQHAWFIHNSGDRPQAVATRKANGFGLYDIIGNAWEWTGDWYRADSYQRADAIDPPGPAAGTKKVRRGGSFHCPLAMTRVAYRAADKPSSRYSVLGLRVVAEAVERAATDRTRP